MNNINLNCQQFYGIKLFYTLINHKSDKLIGSLMNMFVSQCGIQSPSEAEHESVVR